MDSVTGVVSFQAELVNDRNGEPLAVNWLAPAALPLAHDEVLAFDGRWGHEFQQARQRVARRTARASPRPQPSAQLRKPIVAVTGSRSASTFLTGPVCDCPKSVSPDPITVRTQRA